MIQRNIRYPISTMEYRMLLTICLTGWSEVKKRLLAKSEAFVAHIHNSLLLFPKEDGARSSLCVVGRVKAI